MNESFTKIHTHPISLLSLMLGLLIGCATGAGPLNLPIDSYVESTDGVIRYSKHDSSKNISEILSPITTPGEKVGTIVVYGDATRRDWYYPHPDGHYWAEAKIVALHLGADAVLLTNRKRIECGTTSVSEVVVEE